MGRRIAKFDTSAETPENQQNLAMGGKKKFTIHDLKKYYPKTTAQEEFWDAYANDLSVILQVGPAGTGKTSSMRALLNQLNVDSGDIMFVNASDINSVDAVRNIIKPFAMSMSINEELPIRFVFLDEADHLSPQAQAALRNLIEASYGSARFILTANYPKKIRLQ